MLMRGLYGVALVTVLAGCSSAGNPASDYRLAREVPPLKFPAGLETRPIKPLYPIPPGPVPTEWPKKFKAPAPKPLVVADASAPEKTTGSAVAEKPVLTQDGNGSPLISIGGDLNVIWDGLEQALRKAGVKIDDRDQRIGLYYVRLSDEAGKNSPYQLRLTRGQTAYTLTLQKDDDTLAPGATTLSLFEDIVKNWPGEGQP
jgi:outer membrane protein assembly factor BamC